MNLTFVLKYRFRWCILFDKKLTFLSFVMEAIIKAYQNIHPIPLFDDLAYFWFDIDNTIKCKYSHNHQNRNGQADNTQPQVLHKRKLREQTHSQTHVQHKIFDIFYGYNSSRQSYTMIIMSNITEKNNFLGICMTQLREYVGKATSDTQPQKNTTPTGKVDSSDSTAVTGRITNISSRPSKTAWVNWKQTTPHITVKIIEITDYILQIHRWIPRTQASDAEFWCFLWSALE